MSPEDIAAAEKKGRAIMFAVQDLQYDDAYKMAAELSDFEAALLMGQGLMYQRIIEKRVAEIHKLRLVE